MSERFDPDDFTEYMDTLLGAYDTGYVYEETVQTTAFLSQLYDTRDRLPYTPFERDGFGVYSPAIRQYLEDNLRTRFALKDGKHTRKFYTKPVESTEYVDADIAKAVNTERELGADTLQDVFLHIPSVKEMDREDLIDIPQVQEEFNEILDDRELTNLADYWAHLPETA